MYSEDDSKSEREFLGVLDEDTREYLSKAAFAKEMLAGFMCVCLVCVFAILALIAFGPDTSNIVVH